VQVFPLLARGGLHDAEDPAGVLHNRVQLWISAAQGYALGPNQLIAGLVPRVTGVRDPDMTRALTEREQSMEQRARDLAEHAVSSGQTWVRRLGQPPTDPTTQRRWLSAIRTVDRDRWSLASDPRPVGSENVQSLEQLAHMRRAQNAIEVALAAVRQGQSWQSEQGLNFNQPTSAFTQDQTCDDPANEAGDRSMGVADSAMG
jgi:hypothetical protein